MSWSLLLGWIADPVIQFMQVCSLCLVYNDPLSDFCEIIFIGWVVVLRTYSWKRALFVGVGGMEAGRRDVVSHHLVCSWKA